jgi:hypothetical protein
MCASAYDFNTISAGISIRRLIPAAVSLVHLAFNPDLVLCPLLLIHPLRADALHSTASAAGFNPTMYVPPRGIISLFSSSRIHPCLDLFGPSNYINTVASVLSVLHFVSPISSDLYRYTLRHMFFFV